MHKTARDPEATCHSPFYILPSNHDLHRQPSAPTSPTAIPSRPSVTDLKTTHNEPRLRPHVLKPLLPPPVLIDIDRILDSNRSSPYSFSYASRTSVFSTDDGSKDTPNPPLAPAYTSTNKNTDAYIDIEAQTTSRHPSCCQKSSCPTSCHSPSSPSSSSFPYNPDIRTTHLTFGFSRNPNPRDILPFQAHFSFGLAPPSLSLPTTDGGMIALLLFWLWSRVF